LFCFTLGVPLSVRVGVAAEKGVAIAKGALAKHVRKNGPCTGLIGVVGLQSNLIT
jgi:hypothetical protein